MKKYIQILFLILLSNGYSQEKTRKIDTTYAYQTSQIHTAQVLQAENIQIEKFYINSASNALIKGGKNRIVLPIQLPDNTKEWYYRFTASRNEEDIQKTLQTFSLAGELTSYIKSKNPLKNAVNNLVTPPGADICDIYVFDEKNAKLFKDKEDFDYELGASRENYKSGVVAVKNKISNAVYLGLRNTDNLYGIHVAIEVVAIIDAAYKVEETIRIPVYTSFLQ